MPDRDAEKAVAARRAVAEVADGMLVGLGSGSTTAYAIEELGRRVSEGLDISAVATSTASETLARSVGIPMVSGRNGPRVDIAIDGADEIDGTLRAIKGGGGALLREKIVATAAERVIVIVDSSKLVAVLGRFHLPLEVLPFATGWVIDAVNALGVTASVRLRDGTEVLTDQGNVLVDTAFGRIDDPAKLATVLDAIPGILAHGLFLDEIDVLMVGRGSDVEIVTRDTAGDARRVRPPGRLERWTLAE